MSERFTETLRAASEPGWSQAAGHRFVKVRCEILSAAPRRSDPFGNALHHHALDPEIAVRRHPLAGV